MRDTYKKIEEVEITLLGITITGTPTITKLEEEVQNESKNN